MIKAIPENISIEAKAKIEKIIAAELRLQEQIRIENQRIMREEAIRSLKEDGWVFETVERYHPHDNDTWDEHRFKSPRMKNFRIFYPDTCGDLLDLEADAVANEHMNAQFFAEIIQKQVFTKLVKFYRNNNTKEIPSVNIIVGI